MSLGALTVYNSNSFGSLNNSDWTIEFWIKLNTLEATTNNVYVYTSNPVSKFFSTGETLIHEYNSGTINNSINNVISLTNVWYHIAYVKSDITETMYINGIPHATVNSYSNSENTENIFNIIIGSDNNLNSFIDGYISQVSITKYAKYTTTFIPNIILYPSSLTNVLFFLNDNYEDIVTNITLTQYPLNSISKTIISNYN